MPCSSRRNAPRPVAPARFTGWQERPSGRGAIELWNLLADIPGHPAGSTVTRETIERAGYHLPEPPEPRPNPDEDEDLDYGPGEDDYTITPTGPLGSREGVAQGGKFLGAFSSRESAERFIRDRMAREQFFPSVWYISDHGNAHVLKFRGPSKKQIAKYHKGNPPRARRRRRHNPAPSSPAALLRAGDYIGSLKGQASRAFALAYFAHLKDAEPQAPDHRAFHVDSLGAQEIRRELARILGAPFPNPDPRGVCFYCQREVGSLPGYEHSSTCPRYEAPPRRRVKTIRARRPRPASNPPRRVLIYTGGRLRGTWYGRHRNGKLYQHRFGGGTKAIYGLPDGSIQIVPHRGRLWGMH